MDANGGGMESSSAGIRGMVKRYGPLAAQLYVQLSFGAMFLIARIALTRGMSHYTFVMYRQIVAALTICPLAYFFDRKPKPALKFRNVGQIFVLAMLGIAIGQPTYYAGLSYTSTTLASTMTNLNPAITFVIACLLRLEEVDIRSMRGRAKIFGTLLCAGGAVVMTLAKQGPALNLNHIRLLLLDRDWIFGAFLLVVSSFSVSAFIIFQAWIIKEYPSQLSMSALVCLMGGFQVSATTLLLEKPAAMVLKWDLQLLGVVYSGVFCSGFGLLAIMWSVRERGPVFATAFSPLCTVLVAVVEPLLLDVHFHWGSVLGMVMVVGGLYFVLWAKVSGGKPNRNICRQEEASTREHLLPEDCNNTNTRL